MDICGIGVDIVSIARVRKILERHPVRFPQKLLHPNECDDYHRQNDPTRFLARRFAAKEATVKALGLGFTEGIYACKIYVKHDKFGCPSVVLPALLNQHKTWLSISDEKDYAIAQAIVLKHGD